ncbi:MAG TPA: ABC transporter permease [Terracidiphilus sp.]|jgi:predicted permease
MNLVDAFVKKFAILFRRNRFRSDLDEEMAFHRAQAEKEFVARGMSAEEACYAAKRQFGNATRLREESQEQVGFNAETVLHDFRFAIRQMRRNPSFAVLAIVILALGLGASVAIFGFVDAALLQPLPYSNPNRIMDVGEKATVHPRSNLSFEDFRDWARLNHSFTGFDAYTGAGYLLHAASGTEPVPGARVTAGFFRTLGVHPVLGRDFTEAEGRPGAAKVVMLAYGAWVKRFGTRADIVGQSIQLDTDNYTIVGVLPREFSFAPNGNAELWAPIADPSPCEKRRSCHNLFAVGRLRDGVSQAAALDDLKAIAAQLERMYPDSNKGQGAAIAPLSEQINGSMRPILVTLLAGALLLLLIAWVNVASLLLARSESRRREVAVRGALGATHLRLIRQFVTEGLLLAFAGCMAGSVLALWLMSLLTHLVPKSVAAFLPFLGLVGFNMHTALFAVAVTAAATAMLSLTPALRLGFQPIHDGLAEGSRGSAGRAWRRLGANLVVVELAVAVVLLVGAGLLGRSFYKLLHVEMGFDSTHLAMLNVQLPPKAYEAVPRRLEMYRAIQQRLGALPGVVSVGITSDPPVQCFCDTDWIRIVGKPFNGEHNEVVERDVSPAYFTTLKAHLVRGRLFAEDEDSSKPEVILINETLARKYFPGEDPIGKRVGNGTLTPESMRTIIGVIDDFREGALDDQMIPGEYFTLNQQADTGFTVLVRTAQDEKPLLPEMVAALHGLDPNIGTFGEQTMTQAIESTQSALLHRSSTWLVGGFAITALILGVVGLYGVIAYSVSQRTREIGVRMALGAQRSAVYSMVMRQAGWLTCIGVSLGIACSIAASFAMRKLLFGVSAWDITTLATVAVVLALASLSASFIPARRAASVNPTEALRVE